MIKIVPCRRRKRTGRHSRWAAFGCLSGTFHQPNGSSSSWWLQAHLCQGAGNISLYRLSGYCAADNRYAVSPGGRWHRQYYRCGSRRWVPNAAANNGLFQHRSRLVSGRKQGVHPNKAAGAAWMKNPGSTRAGHGHCIRAKTIGGFSEKPDWPTTPRPEYHRSGK